MSRYEAQLERTAIFSCFQAIRHPRRLPAFLRDLVTGTRAYYAAQDVVDLERGELIELVSWTRKMALKMTGSSLFLGLLVFIAVMRSCHAQTVWTPDDFDWSSLKLAPDGKGLYLNLTDYPLPARPEHAALIATGTNGTIEEDAVVFLSFAIGFAWQALNVAVGVGSVITAIQSCTTTDGSAWAVAGCAFGLAGTILSVGQAYQAAQGAGWFASASNTWSQSGLENIALDVFTKRSQLERQDLHERLIAEVLRRTFGETEFLGYVSQSHRLMGRDYEHRHPAAPIHRIRHPRHGLMDIVSRDHINGTRFTITYANHGLAPRQSFQHEKLSTDLMEARFDYEASQADPAHPLFNAAGGYDQLESELTCFGNGNWEGGSVISAQFYDTTAEATFGFASVGIFPSADLGGQLMDFTPSGMPLPTCG